MSKDIYENDCELTDLKDGRPYSSESFKTYHDGTSSGVKFHSIITTVLQVLTLVGIVLIIALLGVVISQVMSPKTECDNTGALTGSNTQPNITIPTVQCNVTAPNVTCNCSVDSTWTPWQVEQVLNNTWRNGEKTDTVIAGTNQTIALNQNLTQLLTNLLQNQGGNTEALSSIMNSLSNLKSTSTSTALLVSNILTATIQLISVHNASINISIPDSCKEIKAALPNSTTGFYTISGVLVYCNMDQLCGSGDGWTRIGYLNMSESSQNCPAGFRLYQAGSVRACGRPVSGSASCQSVQFPSNGISYSQICGRVTGYQYGSTDAVHPTDGPFGHQNDINSYYADGISITHGSPRQHVWTFIAGYSEDANFNSDSNCPCAQGNTVTTPSFVGNDYYCESGNPYDNNEERLYALDPLWDGLSCGALERDCCTATDLPWFHRDYGSNSYTDNIELRVCGDESTTNEDNPISFYEIYVQ